MLGGAPAPPCNRERFLLRLEPTGLMRMSPAELVPDEEAGASGARVGRARTRVPWVGGGGRPWVAMPSRGCPRLHVSMAVPGSRRARRSSQPASMRPVQSGWGQLNGSPFVHGAPAPATLHCWRAPAACSSSRVVCPGACSKDACEVVMCSVTTDSLAKGLHIERVRAGDKGSRWNRLQADSTPPSSREGGTRLA